MKYIAALLSLLLASQAVAEPLKARKSVPKLDKIDSDPQRTLVLLGQVNGWTIDPLISKLDLLDDGKNPIWLIINSPGGSIPDGLRFIERMENLKSPLICEVDSMAFSMAALISTYCPKLYIHKFATVMFHEASFSFNGNETQDQVRLKMLVNWVSSVHKDVARKLGISYKEYKARIHDEWWFSAEEAVQMGFASAVLDKVEYKVSKEDELIIVLSKLEELRNKVVYGLYHVLGLLDGPVRAPGYHSAKL